MSGLKEDITVHLIVCAVWTACFVVGLVLATLGMVGLAARLSAPLGEHVDSETLDFLYSRVYWGIVFGVSCTAGVAIPTLRERQRIQAYRNLGEFKTDSEDIPWAKVRGPERERTTDEDDR